MNTIFLAGADQAHDIVSNFCNIHNAHVFTCQASGLKQTRMRSVKHIVTLHDSGSEVSPRVAP